MQQLQIKTTKNVKHNTENEKRCKVKEVQVAKYLVLSHNIICLGVSSNTNTKQKK